MLFEDGADFGEKKLVFGCNSVVFDSAFLRSTPAVTLGCMESLTSDLSLIKREDYARQRCNLVHPNREGITFRNHLHS